MADARSSKSTDDLSPFWLKSAFPDAQGIFDARYKTLEEVKGTCFVALDANVLLLPYKLENVGLADVIKVYRDLAASKRLVIPAQAAREFAKHRSTKVAEVVKYLRDEASLLKTVLKKKVGSLSGHAGYEEAKKKVEFLAQPIREAQEAINAVADSVAAQVGEDPVSLAYRDLFGGAVAKDPDDCQNEETFRKELKARYDVRRPPGYKDGGKDDEGAGDLILWKTVLAEGSARKSDCILVTGEEKPDWHVQLNGPFQPRLELIEEYRLATNKSLHIIPLSQLLKLFSASDVAIESVRVAEQGESPQERQRRLLLEAELQRANSLGRISERRLLQKRIDFLEGMLSQYADRSMEDLSSSEQASVEEIILNLGKAKRRLRRQENPTLL